MSEYCGDRFGREWTKDALCGGGDVLAVAGMDYDTMFTTSDDQHIVKKICASCPVRVECLSEALNGRVEFGVWGGLTERERRKILRRHPDVTDWRPLIMAGMAITQMRPRQ